MAVNTPIEEEGTANKQVASPLVYQQHVPAAAAANSSGWQMECGGAEGGIQKCFGRELTSRGGGGGGGE